ncbi:MAG: Sulfur carrier protein ThiS [Syntrophus sp. PtaB.Bin075]|nr:MAG: Sulfur carrier protein ThiS [Syntrophus sp. PtaB.Bin075]
MRVRINGREEALPDSVTTLQELVRDRGLVPEYIVIEVNLQVIFRDDWPKVSLRDEDRIEIVSFVGGG